MVQLEQTIEDEVVLEFKRFPKEKQEQVRALVNYATLMGLNGKDLVSIGGKLDRIKTKQEIETNRSIVKNMAIRPINKDTNCRTRWAYESNGMLYYFDNVSYYDVRVKNVTTGKSARLTHYSSGHTSDEAHKTGRWSWLGNGYIPSIMLAVFYGELQLP